MRTQTRQRQTPWMPEEGLPQSSPAAGQDDLCEVPASAIFNPEHNYSCEEISELAHVPLEAVQAASDNKDISCVIATGLRGQKLYGGAGLLPGSNGPV